MRAKHHPPLSIVYVGNDESVIAAFQQLETIRFRTFKNTYETFKGLEEIEPIDALVCENDLPGQSGLSFYDQFFQHFERKAKIQFIFLSFFNYRYSKTSTNCTLHELYCLFKKWIYYNFN